MRPLPLLLWEAQVTAAAACRRATAGARPRAWGALLLLLRTQRGCTAAQAAVLAILPRAACCWRGWGDAGTGWAMAVARGERMQARWRPLIWPPAWPPAQPCMLGASQALQSSSPGHRSSHLATRAPPPPSALPSCPCQRRLLPADLLRPPRPACAPARPRPEVGEGPRHGRGVWAAADSLPPPPPAHQFGVLRLPDQLPAGWRTA